MLKKNGINAFIRERGFQLAVIVIGGIVAFTVLRGEVRVNAVEIKEVKEELAEYPSKEWFDLKFESERIYSDLKFDALEEKIDNFTK